jgi:hypothetical protein
MRWSVIGLRRALLVDDSDNLQLMAEGSGQGQVVQGITSAGSSYG